MHTKNGELVQGFRSCFWCVGYWSGVKLWWHISSPSSVPSLIVFYPQPRSVQML
jgi:hypothetical protein